MKPDTDLDAETVARCESLATYVGGDLIVNSRQPFLDGARELLKRGYDPATPYNTRHANSDVLSFVTTTIGHAAGVKRQRYARDSLPEIRTV